MISGIETSKKPDLSDFPSAKAQYSAPLDFVRPKRRRRWQLLKVALRVLVALVVITAVIVSLGYFFISQGPVSSERLRSEAETQLGALLGEGRIAKIEKAKFAVGHNGLIAIDAENVRILENQTTNLGIAGMVSVTVRALPLLSGRVVAEKVTLENGQFALAPFLSNQGGLKSGPAVQNKVGGEQADIISIDRFLRSIFSAFTSVADAIEEGGLDALVVTNTDIVDYSKLGLRTQRARLVNFTLERNLRFQTGLFFRALLETERSNISFSGQWRRLDEGGTLFTLDGRGLDVIEFTPTASTAYFAAEAPFDFRSSAPYSETGDRRQATIQANFSPGKIRVDQELNSDLKRASLNLRLIPEKNQIELERSPFIFDHMRTELIGGLRFRSDNKPDQHQAIFELIANETVAVAFDESKEPGRAAIRVGGWFENGWKTMQAETIQIKMASGDLNGNATLKTQKSGVALRLNLETEKLGVEEFKQFWPPIIATGARRWAFGGLSGGEMRNAHVSLDFPPEALRAGTDTFKPSQKQLSANVPLVGSTVKTVGELPPLVNASGTLKQKGVDTEVIIDKADLRLPSGRQIALKKSTLTIEDFSRTAQPTKAKLMLNGSAKAFAELGTRQPLRFSQDLGLAANDLDGRVEGDVLIETSLLEGGDFGKVDWRVNAKVTNFSSTKPIDGARFEDADLAIEAKPGSAKINGTAKVNGVPAQIAMVENFGSGAKAGQRSITLSLSDADRK